MKKFVLIRGNCSGGVYKRTYFSSDGSWSEKLHQAHIFDHSPPIPGFNKKFFHIVATLDYATQVHHSMNLKENTIKI